MKLSYDSSSGYYTISGIPKEYLKHLLKIIKKLINNI